MGDAPGHRAVGPDGLVELWRTDAAGLDGGDAFRLRRPRRRRAAPGWGRYRDHASSAWWRPDTRAGWSRHSARHGRSNQPDQSRSGQPDPGGCAAARGAARRRWPAWPRRDDCGARRVLPDERRPLDAAVARALRPPGTGVLAGTPCRPDFRDLRSPAHRRGGDVAPPAAE